MLCVTALSRHRVPAADPPGPGQRGQATMLFAVLVVVVAVSVLAIGRVGGLLVERARARTAADAVALAVAADGPAAAGPVAVANGGTVDDLQVAGDQVEVTVRVGSARATARAERTWSRGGR